MKLTIKENVGEMTVREFLNEIENIYAKYFPNSKCSARLYSGLGKAITVDCFLAGSIEECPNKISGNDMFDVSFWIYDMPRDTELDSTMPDTITLTSDRHSFRVVPTNKYLYFDIHSIPFRKTVGTPEKCLQAFERFVKKLYDAVVAEDANGNIHNSYVDLVKTKI
jgi:hypothetical protein